MEVRVLCRERPNREVGESFSGLSMSFLPCCQHSKLVALTMPRVSSTLANDRNELGTDDRETNADKDEEGRVALILIVNNN